MRKRDIILIAALTTFSMNGAVQASTITNWNGNGSDGLWGDPANWSNGEPGTGYQATFNGSGDGYTAISLGGSTVYLSSLEFTGTPASYTIGTSTGDTLSFDTAGIISNGPTTASTGATANQTVAAGIVDTGSLTINNAIHNSTLSLTGNISGAGSVVFPSGTANNGGTILISGNNSFSGGTTITSSNTSTIEIGSNTAFGTGNLVPNNTNNTPLEAYGSDITLTNPVILNFGFTIANAATPYNLSLNGAFSYNGTARTLTFDNFGKTVTLGDSNNPAAFVLPATTNTGYAQFEVASGAGGNAILVINDVIQDAPGFATPGSTPGVRYGNSGNSTALSAGTVIINGANTYTGTTDFANNASQLTLEIGSSTVGGYGSITSGPFGTGTVIAENTYTPSGGKAEALPPIFEPYGADRTIANAITITQGLFAESAPTTGTGPTVDPAGTTHNLYLTGPISISSSGITNDLASNVGLYLGSSPSGAQAITLTGTSLFQSQQTSTGFGTTYVNDQITGTGNLVVQEGGTYQFLNNLNNYSGTTSLTGGTLLALNTLPGSSATGSGAVSVTGAGSVGSGGILGGTGYISGPVTIGSSTPASQGGVLSPGNGAAGTLNVANLLFAPGGRYVFQYNATTGTPGAGVNDLINGSGTLDLSALSASSPFDLYLNPTSAGSGASSYVLGTFSGGIYNNGVEYAIGSDVTNLFTFDGTQSFTPDVQVVAGLDGGEALELYTSSVPEPASLALFGIGGLSLLRRRRRPAFSGLCA